MPPISMLIQGPVHTNLIKNIELNSELFDTIVVTTWHSREHEDRHVIDQIRRFKTTHPNLNLTVIEAELPLIPESAFNPANFYLQVSSTINGLREIPTENFVKTRSDEYINLKYFVQKFNLNSESPLFLNFIVREWDYMELHMSDHVFAMNTAHAIEAFNLLLSVISQGITHESEFWRNEILGRTSPERLITIAALGKWHSVENLHTLTPKESFTLCGKHFRLFDVENSRPYQLNANHAGLSGVTNFRKLTRVFSKENTIELRYFRSFNDLRPRTKTYRYLRRKLITMVNKLLLIKGVFKNN